MAETLVKNQVCNSCGSEARPHALFCYHCGKALQAGEYSGEENKHEPSDVWFREEITGKKGVVGEEPFEHAETEADAGEFSDELLDKRITKPDEDLDERMAAESPTEPEKEPEPGIQIKQKPPEKEAKAAFNDSKLRSASSLRRRGKPARLKMVEIIWEEKEGSPNIWFMIFALFFCLLVGVLVFISLYIK